MYKYRQKKTFTTQPVELSYHSTKKTSNYWKYLKPLHKLDLSVSYLSVFFESARMGSVFVPREGWVDLMEYSCSEAFF